jgi:hypothetical protein
MLPSIGINVRDEIGKQRHDLAFWRQTRNRTPIATHFEGRLNGFVHVTVVHPIAIMPYWGSPFIHIDYVVNQISDGTRMSWDRYGGSTGYNLKHILDHLHPDCSSSS